MDETGEAATTTNANDYAGVLLGLWESQGRLGSWSWSLDDDRLRWSAGLFRMLGLDPLAVEPSWPLLESLVLPEDAGADAPYSDPSPTSQDRTGASASSGRAAMSGGCG